MIVEFGPVLFRVFQPALFECQYGDVGMLSESSGMVVNESELIDNAFECSLKWTFLLPCDEQE